MYRRSSVIDVLSCFLELVEALQPPRPASQRHLLLADLEPERDREERLHDTVVHLTCDAVALAREQYVAALLGELGVLDR